GQDVTVYDRTAAKAEKWVAQYGFFFSSRRRHTRSKRDWSSDVCSSDLSVTAEVASSSLVVPAIPNQALTPVEEFSRGHKKVQTPREASNSAHSSPITMFTFNLGLGG